MPDIELEMLLTSKNITTTSMEDNDIITCEVASSVRTKTIFVKLSPQSTVRDLLDKIADRYSKPRDFFSLYFVVNLSEPNESDDDNVSSIFEKKLSFIVFVT